MYLPVSKPRWEALFGPVLGLLCGGGVGLLSQHGGKGTALAIASGFALSVSLVVFALKRRNAARSTLLGAVIAFGGIAVWGGLQFVHSSSLITDDTRFWSYKFKNYWGAGVVCCLFLWTSFNVITKHLTITSSQVALLCAGLLFPVYSALSLAARGYFNLPLVSMYFLWALYAFWELPILLTQEGKGILFCKIAMASLLLLTISGILVGIGTGNLYWTWTTRMSFVFHVVAYGHALSVLAALALIFFVESEKKKAFLLLYGVALLLAVLAVSRNTIVFILFAAASFFFGQRGKKKEWMIAFCLLLLISVLFLRNWGISEDDIDKLSSGRLSLFSSEFTSHLPSDRLLWWLFGSETFLGAERTLVLDAVGVDARFERNVTDNSYLSILLGHGLVGLLLFLAPFFYIYAKLHSSLHYAQKSEAEKRRAYLALALLEGLAVQSLFMITMPSMGNLVSIFLPGLWLLADEFQQKPQVSGASPVRLVQELRV
jgi:hypothetical protein